MLDKSTIERWIMPLLDDMNWGVRQRRSPAMIDVLYTIFYRLKTGCQWRHLPMQECSPEHQICWQTAYYHFRRLVEHDVWQSLWIRLLALHKQYLSTTIVQLDGSHTIAKGGGEFLGYQGRKKARTTNLILLSDQRGQPLACSQPIEGQHHDLYDIETVMQTMQTMLTQAGISLDVSFLNADAGFDAESVRSCCHQYSIYPNIALNPRNGTYIERDETCDEELYAYRFVIERTHAWLDGFKSLLVRFEKLANTWLSLHFLAFIALFIRSINARSKKSLS